MVGEKNMTTWRDEILPDLPEKTRAAIVQALEHARDWGAGDALSGLVLGKVTKQQFDRLCEILKVKDKPSCFTMAGAFLSLLSCSSDDPVVQKALKELDRQARSDVGYNNM